MVKRLPCNAGDPGLIPGLGRSPGEGNGNPFLYSCLENSMDRGAWWSTVHGDGKSQTRLSDWSELNWTDGLSSSHVRMWNLDYKESWALKNWCFWTVVLEKTLESPLDCNEIKPANSIGNQPWHSPEGLILKLKLQYFGHLMQRANSLEKTLMLGKIEGRRRRGWQRMRWLDGITDSMDEFEETRGDSEEQGSLICCTPWSHKELDTT